MQRHLQATHSRYASEHDIRQAGLDRTRKPDGLRLMAHQVQTYRALQEKRADVIINGALTGDGKSLAAALPSLLDDAISLFIYPTNELMRDQNRALDVTLPMWGHSRRTRPVAVINAPALDAMQDKLAASRPDALEFLLEKDLALTNPDVLHLLMQFIYQQRGAAPDALAVGKVGSRFDLICQDEFHIFGAPEAAAMVMAMALLREVNPAVRLLLLSATSDHATIDLLQKAGLSVHLIEGDYRHGNNPSADYRTILHEATLRLHPGNLEDWVAEHLDDVILAFFREHRPGAKGAIICTSVATAHVLLGRLREPCEFEGITVGINTGLTGMEDRQGSLDADLIIGTSTVDVGVDFKINLLIFESTDAASHIQRLGRLGRHAEGRDGSAFHDYEAHGLLPPWVIARLDEMLPGDEALDRPTYYAAIHQAFPSRQQYHAYPKMWSVLQAAHVLRTLDTPVIREQYKAINASLMRRYAEAFGFRQPETIHRYNAMRKSETDRPLLDAATAFRGGDDLTVLVETQQLSGHRAITPYSLLSLLPRADVTSLSLEDVYRQAEAGAYDYSRIALERQKPLLAYRLAGWLAERRRLSVYLDGNLNTFGQPIVLRGLHLRIEKGTLPGIMELNRILENRLIPATVIRGYKLDEVRRRLRLDGYFRLLPFQALNVSLGCIALGREALLLASALKQSSLKASGSALIL